MQRKRTGVVAEGESGVKDDDGDDDDDGRPWRPCHREHRRDVRDETVVAVVGGDYNAVKGDLVRVEPMRGRRHHRLDKDERCDPKPRLEEAQETRLSSAFRSWDYFATMRDKSWSTARSQSWRPQTFANQGAGFRNCRRVPNDRSQRRQKSG